MKTKDDELPAQTRRLMFVLLCFGLVLVGLSSLYLSGFLRPEEMNGSSVLTGFAACAFFLFVALRYWGTDRSLGLVAFIYVLLAVAFVVAVAFSSGIILRVAGVAALWSSGFVIGRYSPQGCPPLSGSGVALQ